MARAASSPELVKYRSPKKWGLWRAAIFTPQTIYTARVNGTFGTTDGILEIPYDGGVGDLADVLPDMTVFIGSSPGDYDVGICRLRDKDSGIFYVGETSDIELENDLYLTIVNDFGLWARHVLIDDNEHVFMDGGVAYSDQHTDFDPVPILGGHKARKLTGADVSTAWDGSGSYVIDGSGIASYAWSAPGSSSSSGMTSATPTISYDSPGWYLVYLTVTADNGKSFFGVRYVYIWNDDNPPSPAVIDGMRQDAENGGWESTITLLYNATLQDIHERSFVILFAENYFDNEAADIGPLTGSENIRMVGWISNETINWNPEQGTVRFPVQGHHFWFDQIPAFPDGVEFSTHPPSAWTSMKNLTVDLGVWHFLHWRTTATRVMDIFLSGDTKYTKEVSAMSGTIWEQIKEMTWQQIYARPGVNAQGQFFLEVHPQLVPEADRDWPNVMEITREDWRDNIEFERITKTEVAVLSLSGMFVNSNGKGSPFFSLAPGHAYPRYGGVDVQDNILVASQQQANVLAGLYRSHENNEFPNIPIPLVTDAALIDCFPRQTCSLVIDPEDTPRGISYNGRIIPSAIELSQDPETGTVYRDVRFEAETFESLAINGDIPGGRSDPSTPPPITFPPLPPIGPPVPGGIPSSIGAPKKVLLHDLSKGLIYTENFNAENPGDVHWITINAGLSSDQYPGINHLFVCPNGTIYVARVWGVTSVDYLFDIPFIARALPGATFEILYSEEDLRPSAFPSGTWGVWGIGVNPLQPEQVGIIIGANGENRKFHLGNNGVFVDGATMPDDNFTYGISYGVGTWLITLYDHFWRIVANGSSIASSGIVSFMEGWGLGTLQQGQHRPASTTGKTFHGRNGAPKMIVGENNLLTTSEIGGDADWAAGNPKEGFDCDPSGLMMMGDWGAGQKGRSFDGGATWSGLATLPPGGAYVFCYAGQSDEGVAASRWIAARGVIRYSPDGGSTWINREGDISSSGLVPFPDIDLIVIVEY